MAKEVYDEETGNWVAAENKNFLESSYDYLSENVPKLANKAASGVVSNALSVNDALSDFFYEPDSIPTLSNDLAKPGAVPTMNESLRRAGGAEAARRPGWETALIKGAKEVGTLVEGAQDLMDSPPGIRDFGGGAERIAERERIRNNVKPIMEGVSDARPASSAIGATAPYFTPGVNAPLKLAGIPLKALDPAAKRLAKGTYDLASKISDRGLRRTAQRSAIDLRLLPSKLAESTGANVISQGGIVGALHPDMTAEEGAFYATGGYGLGKFAGGKLTKPKSFNKPEKNELVKWGKNMGYDIDPGVQTGDIRFQQLDQAFYRNADTAGPFQLAKLKNRDTNSRIVTKMVGEETDNISDAWFERTGKVLRDQKEEIYDNLHATYNPSVSTKINNISKQYTSDFGEQNIKGQYNPNHNPIVDEYVAKVWKLMDDGSGFTNRSGEVNMTRWKGVRNQVDARIDQYAKDPASQHLVPYFDNLADTMDDMLSGSKNKEFLKRLKKNKLKTAVRINAMQSNKVAGEIDMIDLENRIAKKYGSQIRGVETTGNQNLDDFYNALKLNKAMSDTHGASLGVSDRVSRLFTNPASRATGRLGYLFSKNAHDIGRINSSIINAYRRSPTRGLPNNMNLGLGLISTDELAGAIAGRYAISEQ